MSIRVCFWHGSPDGLLTHFLLGPLADALMWARAWHADDPGDITESTVALLEQVTQDGLPALVDATRRDPAQVDALLELYYGLYGDFHAVLEPAADALLRLHWYQELLSRLHAHGHQQTTDLMAFIVTGRPFLRDPAVLPFQSAVGVFRVAWWTAAEVADLHAWLHALPETTQRALDPDWGALPTMLDALDAALARKSGVILTVT